MKTKASNIFFMILFTFITTIAQFILKVGSRKSNIINWYVFLGLLVYGLGTIIYLLVLKDSELSAIYPIISLGFVWIVLISWFFLKETITLNKIIGVSMIIIGVSILGVKK